MLEKCLKNTCQRVTFPGKMQITDLQLYLKRHPSAGVFQKFCKEKPTTWFLQKWNVGQKRIKGAGFPMKYYVRTSTFQKRQLIFKSFM